MALDRRNGSLYLYLGDQMWKGIDRLTFKRDNGEIRWPDEEAVYKRAMMCRASPDMKDRWLQEQERMYRDELEAKKRSEEDDARYETEHLVEHKLGELGVCGYGKASAVVDGLKGK